MKIAINATFSPHGGWLTYLRYGVKELLTLDTDNEYLLFVTPQNLAKIKPYLGSTLKNYRIFRIPGMSRPLQPFWEQIFLPFHLKREKVNLLFCIANFCPFFSTVRTIVMLRHAVPFYSKANSTDAVFLELLALKEQRLMMSLSARRANHVIFISHFISNLIINRHAFLRGKSTVIYNGANAQAYQNYQENPSTLKEFGITNPYILCVSHLISFKNIPQMIKGFKKTTEVLKDQKIKLVFAGKFMNRWYFSKVMKTVRSCNLEDQVKFTGRVSHEQLFALYFNCLFFAITSTGESFCNALVEAMSCGKPILGAKLGVIPEICRDAALYCDPYSIDDIAKKMILMIKNAGLRKELSTRSLKRVKEFPTWAEVARKTQQLIELVGKR